MTSKNCHSENPLMGKKIGFIGAGNMARAIIHGLIKSGFHAKNIFCANPSLAKLEQLNQAFPELHISQRNSDIVQQADILILAVKPQMMSLALSSIATADLNKKLVISVAAGVETQSIAEQLHPKLAIVRSMPNTPVTIGFGATGLFANEFVSKQQRQAAENIFNAVGVTAWIEHEEQMDLVTAISGSGPAHYFLFLEAIIQSAIEQGMDADTAKLLALQTALGAASMASQNSTSTIKQLRDNVTSPGGTTAAAIESFQTNEFTEIIDQAIKASVNRGKELAKIANQSNINNQESKQI